MEFIAAGRADSGPSQRPLARPVFLIRQRYALSIPAQANFPSGDRRRVSGTFCSAEPVKASGFCLISGRFGHDDEPEIPRYEYPPIEGLVRPSITQPEAQFLQTGL
jgi:hypothetical protein